MLSTEDVLAIQALLADYGHVLDDHDWDRAHEVFAEDLVFERGDGRPDLIRPAGSEWSPTAAPATPEVHSAGGGHMGPTRSSVAAQRASRSSATIAPRSSSADPRCSLTASSTPSISRNSVSTAGGPGSAIR